MVSVVLGRDMSSSTPAGLPYRVAPDDLLRFTKDALQSVGADDWTVEVVATSLVNAR